MMNFIKGNTYYILRSTGKPYKIHILAIVDSNMVVFKWYGRHKQWWHYEIQHANILESEIQYAEGK